MWEEIIFWDDISGKCLEPGLCREARKEEIEGLKKYGVYIKVPISKCYDVTGKEPLGIRWAEVNIRDSDNPEYRSRLVAREIRRGKIAAMYAATPPLEALRMLISWAATVDVSSSGVVGSRSSDKCILIADVSRAFFEAPARRDVCVELPGGSTQPG